MKRELGIARCGLACCLCSENDQCGGCDAGNCPMAAKCVNRICSAERNLTHCYECEEACRKGLLSKLKPYGFTEFARRYGIETLLDCLERNEQAGVIYHRQGVIGDYDELQSIEDLIAYIQTGRTPS